MLEPIGDTWSITKPPSYLLGELTKLTFSFLGSQTKRFFLVWWRLENWSKSTALIFYFNIVHTIEHFTKLLEVMNTLEYLSSALNCCSHTDTLEQGNYVELSSFLCCAHTDTLEQVNYSELSTFQCCAHTDTLHKTPQCDQHTRIFVHCTELLFTH